VTVAAALVLYAACVGTLGSWMLGRATWPARAPLLAIVTYPVRRLVGRCRARAGRPDHGNRRDRPGRRAE
jgi:hypothetical protein